MGAVVKYGVEWETSRWTPIKVELYCYLKNHTPEKGGLGRAGHLINAMKLLWPETYQGEWERGYPKLRPHMVEFIKDYCSGDYDTMILIGHAGAGKSHDIARVVTAEYLASYHDTIVTLTSTDLKGLKDRIWSEVVSAIKSARGEYKFDFTTSPHPLAVPMVYVDGGKLEKADDRKHIIRGIPVGRDENAVGKIQGVHSKRCNRLVVDEAQETPPAVLRARANLMVDKDFKSVLLANATNRHTPFGELCEPVDGWDSVDPEHDFSWECKSGWVESAGRSRTKLYRLDATRSPNVLAGRVIYPYLITKEKLEMMASEFGENSVYYWAFGRGFFAPDNAEDKIIPEQAVVEASREADYFFEPPLSIAAIDPAYEGGDKFCYVSAEVGKSAQTLQPLVKLRRRVHVRKEGDPGEPLARTLARRVMELCKEDNVAPRNLISDFTGASRDVVSQLQTMWGMEVIGCSFAGGATERKILDTDEKEADRLYDRLVSEMCFATKAFMEAGIIRGMGGEQFSEMRTQLVARTYTLSKEKRVVQTKKAMRKLVRYSPDDADCLNLIVELCRRRGVAAGRPQVFVDDDPKEFALQLRKQQEASIPTFGVEVEEIPDLFGDSNNGFYRT